MLERVTLVATEPTQPSKGVSHFKVPESEVRAHTNGLLRQCFPNGRNLRVHGPDDLRAVEDRLNNRPEGFLVGPRQPSVYMRAMAP
jgi:hypothetical protein